MVAYNNGSFTDARRAVYDWVELKNVSGEDVSLSGYTFTNDIRLPELLALPEVTLRPGELYVLFCSDEVERPDMVHMYAPFNISSQGERLYLLSPGGELSDSVHVRDLTYAGSMGRAEDVPGFCLFETPTPGKPNNTGFRYKSSAVTADVDSGIYNDVEALTVTLQGRGDIYYTLDGSVPTRKSPVYTEPITLAKSGVIRAFALEEGKAAGDTATFQYIINENHTLPVVSLATEPRHFRSVVAGQRVAEGVVALFSEQGTEFVSGCTYKLHGNTSKFFREKKLFMVEFNNRFGGNIQGDIFGDGEVTEFSSLLLRGETVRFSYLLRDSVAAEVAQRVSDTVLALANRYCVLYVNGEYYGIYPLREDYSRQYVASHTGSSPESCVVVVGPVTSTNGAKGTDLYEVLTYITSRSMAVPEYYAWASERVDMTAMADWLLLEGYFNNMDVGGNIRYVYGDNTGGKWRPAFFDFDIALTAARRALT